MIHPVSAGAYGTELDPGAGAGEDLARGVMEVQVPQRRNVLDLEAADLQLFEPVAGRDGTLGGALRAPLSI